MKTLSQFINEDMDMIQAHMAAAKRRRAMAKHPRWAHDNGMKRMFNKDADDHIAIAQKIQKNDKRSAEKHFYNMDTDARDEVFVGKHKKHALNYYNHRKIVTGESVDEARLGGAKYAGKENPNKRHTRDELNNAKRKHRAAGDRILRKADDDRSLELHGKAYNKEISRSNRRYDAEYVAGTMRDNVMYKRKDYRESVEEATLGGAKYKGKSNPNNTTTTRKLKHTLNNREAAKLRAREIKTDLGRDAGGYSTGLDRNDPRYREKAEHSVKRHTQLSKAAGKIYKAAGGKKKLGYVKSDDRDKFRG